MNSREQNIKNGAIGLAIALAVIIIGIMCIGVYSVISIFTPEAPDAVSDKTILELYPGQAPEVIVIDNAVGQLTIEAGDIFQVSGSNVLKDFSCKFEDGTLTVTNTYNKKGQLSGNTKSSLTITVPKGTDLKRLNITTGAGNCTIKGISADKAEIETGAGNATITDFESDTLTLTAGAGNIEFISSALSNITLSCGVGNFEIKSSDISGKCKIECGVGNFSLTDCNLTGEWKAECGVGEFKLDLNGELEDYEINIDSSVGKVKLNGKTHTKVEKLNKGAENKLEIDGGIGEITINID